MRNRSRNGFTLIEALIYLAVLVVLLELSYGAYFQYDGSSRSLRGNAADIERVMHAGERWRSDLRQSVRPPRLVKEVTGASLVIPQAKGDVTYWFAQGKVWRKAGPQTLPILAAVQSSAMEADSRQQVVAWRWEVELTATRKNVPVRPLFTFEAVAPFRE